MKRGNGRVKARPDGVTLSFSVEPPDGPQAPDPEARARDAQATENREARLKAADASGEPPLVKFARVWESDR